MHVVWLKVNNYGPFKGIHNIALGASVYGIIGRHADDPGRSNWLGKSWIVGAIRYALYGAHGASSDDAIIHRGESECYVGIEMDDGTVVGRSRKTGKSTQLKYTALGGKPATQKRAQELIVDYMKMDLTDFDASCFIEQKQIARLVTALPSERTKLVNAWLELGPLQDAASYASDHLRTLLAAKNQNALAQESTTAAFENFEPEQAREEKEKLTKKIDGMVELRAILKDEIQVGRDWARHKGRADEFEHLLRWGKTKAEEVTQLEARLAVADDEGALEQEVQAASTASTNARARHDEDKALAKGKFDGMCPVMKLGCPSYDAVVETKDDAKLRLPQHVENGDRLALEYENAMGLKTDRVTVERGLEVAKRDLDQIRIDANDRVEDADFIAENPEPVDVEAMEGREEQYDNDISDMKADLTQITARLAGYDAAQKVAKQYGPAVQKLDDDIRTAREAVAILGRGGAQKEIAATALAEIETLANGLLSQASIDLTLAVRWAREGKGLASHCDACGTPFGTSARVKVCPGCNATRGPKLIEKLELELSNSSGAADDMAGLAFQLAASSWLRKKRGSDWSVVFIDEPFGALDETNARNLSSHLHTLIRGQFGFEQGFLVSHGQQIMAAMPARVVVSSDGVSSSLAME